MDKIIFASPPIDLIDHKLLKKTLNSGWIGLGKNNFLIEQEFKKILKKKYVLSVSSGTSAAWLSLNALNLNKYKKSEILVPSLCYASPLNMLKKINFKGKIIPIEMDQKNLQISINDLKKKINKNTLAVLVIHNYGNTANTVEIKKIIKQKKLKTKIIEDFSESIFSKYEEGRYAGYFGDIAFCSLHATKTITSGEGGIIACNDKNTFTNIKQASRNGMRLSNIPYQYDFAGFNFKMSNILASIVLPQIKNKKKIINKRRIITNYYSNIFKKFNWTKTIKIRNDENPTMWAFPVILKNLKLKNKLHKFLQKKNIETRISFSSISDLKYLKFKKNNFLKKNKLLAEKILMFPNHTSISIKNIEYLKKNLTLFEKKFVK